MKSVLSIVIVLAALLGLGYFFNWYFDIYDFSPGPDRTAVLKTFLEGQLHISTDDPMIAVRKTRHVKGTVLDKVREKHPTFEIIDCEFTHKDGTGKISDINTQHFFLIEGKVIDYQGRRFWELHKQDPPEDLEKRLLMIVAEKTMTAAEQQELRKELGVPKGGPPAGPGKGKGKGKGGPGKQGPGKQEKSDEGKGKDDPANEEKGTDDKAKDDKAKEEKGKDDKAKDDK